MVRTPSRANPVSRLFRQVAGWIFTNGNWPGFDNRNVEHLESCDRTGANAVGQRLKTTELANDATDWKAKWKLGMAERTTR